MRVYLHKIKRKFLHKCMDSKGIVFHITGLIAILWFLSRSGTKPDRVYYPCQQMSMTIATGYIAFWAVLWGSMFFGLGLWMKRAKHKTTAYFPLILVVFILIFSTSSNVYADFFINKDDSPVSWQSVPNEPIGEPYGVNPGRVVWVWDPDATEEKLSGFWWNNVNNDQFVLDDMMAKGIKGLIGVDNEEIAWDNLFKHFNINHGKGDIGYQPGEKIAIKVNLNNCWQLLSYIKIDNDRDASPFVVKSLLKQLIEVVGVAQEDITVYDASRPMANWFYNRLYYETYPSIFKTPEFPNIHYVDSKGGMSGREKAQPSNEKIYFSDGSVIRTLPTCVAEADYLINMPILKRHPIENGVTLSGKNFFGTWIEDVAPIHDYHRSGLIMGNPAPQTDLLAHEHVGGKTLLFIGDGIYATKIDHSTIEKFQMYPFNNDWTNSLFFSQDPVAMDSVMYDFLHAEGTNPIEGSQNYLHQSAEPTLNYYDPEGDGVFLDYSLGVHEHWDTNDDIFSTDRYSGPENNGIDFLPVYENRSIKITQPLPYHFYFNSKKMFRSFNTLVFGEIMIKTEIEKETNNIDRVAFFIDGDLINTDFDAPYEWIWANPSNGKFTLEAVCFFNDGTSVSDKILVQKFF